MRRRHTALVVLVSAAVTLAALPVAAQPRDLWRDATTGELPTQHGERDIVPTTYRLLALDLGLLQQLLAQAPTDPAAASGTIQVDLPLPMPDGRMERFRMHRAPIMEPELARRFPGITTFRGQGIDDPTATLRCDITPRGFHAQVLRAGTAVFIDPLFRGDTTWYQSYLKSDLVRDEVHRRFSCTVLGGDTERPGWSAHAASQPVLTPSGSTLRTYRLALAGTGEYTTAVCSPEPAAVSCGLAAMVTSLNRVDGVYEREVAISMVLVANNDLLVYTNGATDPYSNSDGTTMLGQNQANLDAVIGNANYDIGHVFSTGGGGVAYLGVPCRSGWKAQGVTGSAHPVGDPFDIDYVAHEMGHQWDADHTFNGSTGSCGGGNRVAGAAYEPGSGSTIMSYAGICGTEDLQPHSDAVFHTKSFDQIVAYSSVSSGNTCAQKVATGNSAPVVSAGPSVIVPKQTPFTLTGTAADANGDVLAYAWEEYDLGAASPPQGDATASRPIFRSFATTTSPSRTFPRLSDILGGTQTFGEWMSQRSRAMTFRLTARDNRAAGGGVNWASTTVQVSSAAGPFAVTAPAAGATWSGGDPAPVTWSVANTTASPVSCAAVDILLSLDGGSSFPVTLATATPNDGAETVVAPAVSTTQARVKVACSSSVFFDISNPDFVITCAAPAAFSLGAPVNGAGVSGNVVTLQWGPSSGASQYEVYLGPVADPPLLQSTTQTTLTTSLTPGQTYFWRIVATGACGQQAAPPSGTWSFEVTAPVLAPTTPMGVDSSATLGSTGDLNGVLEPGEAVTLAPRWRNDGTAAVAFTGTLTAFQGPPGAVYTLLDSTGDYGTLDAGEAGGCELDAYAVGVDSPATRPAPHWDVTVRETTSTGQARTWTVHVGDSFADVPPEHWAYRDIEALYHAGTTRGCADPPLQYCPENLLTRAETAVLLIRASHGPTYVPPPATGTAFEDVPIDHWAAAEIEQLQRDGITSGCTDPAHFCPDRSLSRAEVAVFLLRLVHGAGHEPPTCTGAVFADVPADHWACAWIEELFAEGITVGCASELFCPEGSLPRGGIAVFLKRALGLQLAQ